MSDYLFSGVLIAVSFVTGWILYFLVFFIIKRGDTLPLKWRKVNLELLKKPLRFLMPALCISVVIPFLRLPEKAGGFIGRFIQILLIVLFGWVIVKIVCIIRDALLDHYDINARDNVRARSMHTQIRLIANIISVVVVLLTVSFVLMSFSGIRQIGISLLASAGIMGIVIGFAAQRTLGNLIAGIQIAIAQPIRLDDVVIIENEWGWIEEITLTFVVVRIWDLRRLVIPISYLLEKPFQNWTRTSADILGSVFIYADYTIPVKEARDELTRILEDSQYWDKKVNVLQVTDAKERVIELRALMSAVDSPAAWNLRCEVREKLLVFLQNKFPECLPRIRIEMNNGGSS